VVDGRPQVYQEEISGKKSKYNMNIPQSTFKELEVLLKDLGS
jgi:hypothetical protein